MQSGDDHATMHALVEQLTRSHVTPFVPRSPRPDPRRPRRPDVTTYRIRVDLKGARPPRWRRLDVASSLMLDQLHAVLQAAFGLEDCHLHRFAVGGSPYDRDSAIYLCPFDVEENDEGDGVDERDVRLDELLAERGDSMTYLYDFGDDWEFAVTLEKTLPREGEEPAARCVDGRRGDIAEDSGGVHGLEELIAVGEWDDAFDREGTDEAVREAVGAAAGVPPLVLALLERLAGPAEVEVRALAAGVRPPVVAPDVAERLVHRYRWLAGRVGADGVKLTSAGYLAPELVRELMTQLKLAPRYLGAWNRDDLTPAVADLRQAATDLGVVRPVKGRLTVPAAVRKVVADPFGLLAHVANRLPVGKPGSAEHDAGVLALLWRADGRNPRSREFDAWAARVLAALGWQAATGPVTLDDVHALAWRTLNALDQAGDGADGRLNSPDVALVCHAALLRG